MCYQLRRVHLSLVLIHSIEPAKLKSLNIRTPGQLQVYPSPIFYINLFSIAPMLTV
jgi:hypothetical protein